MLRAGDHGGVAPDEGRRVEGRGAGVRGEHAHRDGGPVLKQHAGWRQGQAVWPQGGWRRRQQRVRNVGRRPEARAGPPPAASAPLRGVIDASPKRVQLAQGRAPVVAVRPQRRAVGDGVRWWVAAEAVLVVAVGHEPACVRLLPPPIGRRLLNTVCGFLLLSVRVCVCARNGRKGDPR